MKTLIVSGGNVDILFLEDILKEKHDCIIAVDKGIEALHELNIKPNYIVGDFDSVNKEIINIYRNENIPIQQHNPEKDYTDTELGIKLAISLKSTKISVVGGIGTRLDHTLANIHILKHCLDNDIVCEMLDEHNKVYLINHNFQIEKSKAFGKYISIIPLTTEVSGITLKGFKYPLKDYTLAIGKSLGISNEIEDDYADIDLKEGILIVIESKD